MRYNFVLYPTSSIQDRFMYRMMRRKSCNLLCALDWRDLHYYAGLLANCYQRMFGSAING